MNAREKSSVQRPSMMSSGVRCSGLNIAAAVRLAEELGPGKVVATVAVDTGLKYLAGDLFALAAGVVLRDREGVLREGRDAERAQELAREVVREQRARLDHVGRGRELGLDPLPQEAACHLVLVGELERHDGGKSTNLRSSMHSKVAHHSAEGASVGLSRFLNELRLASHARLRGRERCAVESRTR